MILTERSIIQHTYCLYYNFKVRDFLLPSPIIMKEKKNYFARIKKIYVHFLFPFMSMSKRE